MWGEGNEVATPFFDKVGLSQELNDIVDGSLVKIEPVADGVEVAVGKRIAERRRGLVEGDQVLFIFCVTHPFFRRAPPAVSSMSQPRA